MRNTLEDYEFENAEKEVQRMLDGIYCKTCDGYREKQNLEMSKAKEFVYAVLEA